MLVGSMLPDPSWQARAKNGFDISRFAIDWESKLVRCPEGKASTSWVEGRNAHGHENVHVTFRSNECAECRVRGQCTKSRYGPRTLTISGRPYHEALQQARQRCSTTRTEPTIWITSETANGLLCFARRPLSVIIRPLSKGGDQIWHYGNPIPPFIHRHA
jgi:hypothetical protein